MIPSNSSRTPRRLLSSCLLLLAAAVSPAVAATKDLGNGFADHGVCVPISNHRGTVATVDGQGHKVLLQWLMDHRGGYCLLMLDADTGTVEQFDMPFKFTEFDAPYASILSSKNKFYTHLNNRFVEFDPVARKFTAVHTSKPQMAMSMTEDDAGRIWSVTYPDGGLVSYDPTSKQFVDYGHVHKENWRQYNRAIAADDAGFVYFGVGSTHSQIVAFDPKTKKATPILPESERKAVATGHVVRDENGKVYGQAKEGKDQPWYELHKGEARKLDAAPANLKPKKYISGSQVLNETTFPDGTKAFSDLVNRVFTVVGPDGKKKEHKFDYRSDGAIVMGLIALPDGTLCGGTAFPMRYYHFDPKADKLQDRVAYGQWNTVARQGDDLVVFGYPSGYLLDYDHSKPWVATDKAKPDTNPRFLTQVTPVIHRPHDLLPLPDGHTVVAGGTPAYGHTGGGILIYDRKAKSQTLLKDTDLIPDQSVNAMALVDDNTVLVGTTTTPGSGGEKKAKQATLYTFDVKGKKITWQAPLIEGAQEYTDLFAAPGGKLIYGLADSHLFFVFDPAQRKIVHQYDTKKVYGDSAHEQGPRLFHRNPADTAPDAPTYLLFQKGIAKIDPKSHALSWVAKSPVHINAGGDVVDNRLYFISESHLCSYKLK